MTRDATPHTLVIDIGGTGIKMITLDGSGQPLCERARRLTPQPATPEAVLGVIAGMVPEQPPFERVSVGFPGVVRRGCVETAHNLGTPPWVGYDLAASIQTITGHPTRVMNDADLQGFGVIEGRGMEMVLTLGTGLGTAMYIDGRLVPNLEFGHHPWDGERSYEDMVGNAARKRIGKPKWRRRVDRMLRQLQRIFNPDRIWLGGGNAKALKPEELPGGVSLFTNVEGLAGGVRMWEHQP